MKTLKKISVMLVCVVLLISAVLPTSAFARPPNTSPIEELPWSAMVNTTAGLNVRADAGTNHPVVATLPNFRQLHIRGATTLANGELWYQVYFNGTSGQSGFVLSTLVIVPAESSRWVFRVTGSVVNYREGPGTNTPVIGTIARGVIMPRASVAATVNGFNNVVYRGLGNGWMSSSFLESAT